MSHECVSESAGLKMCFNLSRILCQEHLMGGNMTMVRRFRERGMNYLTGKHERIYNLSVTINLEFSSKNGDRCGNIAIYFKFIFKGCGKLMRTTSESFSFSYFHDNEEEKKAIEEEIEKHFFTGFRLQADIGGV